MNEYDENNLNQQKPETDNNEAEKPQFQNNGQEWQQTANHEAQQPQQPFVNQQPPINNAYSQQPYYPDSNQQRYYYGQSRPYGSKAPNYVYYGNNPQQQQSYVQTPQNHNGQVPNSFNSVQQVPPPKNNKRGKNIFIACIVMIAVVSIIITAVTAGGKLGKKELTTEKVDGPKLETSDSQSASFTAQGGELTAAGIYDKVKESSVGVLVYSSNSTVAAGEGSGVIVGEDDAGKFTYIITCAHVIADSSSVRIQLYDETQCEATVIGSDARTDLAVLRIAKTGLKAFEIGDSDKLVVGETVYAIGNPGGVDFAGSFTNGMISAIARPISSEIGYKMVCVQHTAAINPGNSGGALVNSKGQLIGINSSKIASTDYEGMGFSVPSKTFVEVYNEIMEHGYVTNRPKLGITYTPASASQTYAMLVGVKELPAGSLIIQSINADSSLVGTGAAVGDLITKVNGKELETSDMLPKLIEQSKVGDKLTLTICHFDKNYQMSEFNVEITLVEDKGETENIEETTTVSDYYYWNPFGSYFGE